METGEARRGRWERGGDGARSKRRRKRKRKQWGNKGRRGMMGEKDIREGGKGGGDVCQHLMLSHWDRSTAGLNAALPALGTRGVSDSLRDGEDEGREIKTGMEEIKWEIHRKHGRKTQVRGRENSNLTKRWQIEDWEGVFRHTDACQSWKQRPPFYPYKLTCKHWMFSLISTVEKAHRCLFRTVFVRDNYYSDLTSVFAALLCFLMINNRPIDRQPWSDRFNSKSMKELWQCFAKRSAIATKT